MAGVILLCTSFYALFYGLLSNVSFIFPGGTTREFSALQGFALLFFPIGLVLSGALPGVALGGGWFRSLAVSAIVAVTSCVMITLAVDLMPSPLLLFGSLPFFAFEMSQALALVLAPSVIVLAAVSRTNPSGIRAVLFAAMVAVPLVAAAELFYEPGRLLGFVAWVGLPAIAGMLSPRGDRMPPST